MTRKFVFILSLCVLLASLLCIGFNNVEVKASDGIDPSKVYGVEMLWNNSMSINDVAVSKDGNYIAAVNSSGLYYFAANNSSPRWWENPPTYFISVAISADGEYVAVGSSDGYIYYFNNSRARMGDSNAPTWGSVNLYGPVDRGTLDISDDGEYVVAGGTGYFVYYFAGCKSRFSSNENPTWQNSWYTREIFAVRISPDGRYVAAGGSTYPSGGIVLFYKDAYNYSAPVYQPDWYANLSLSKPIRDLALSDDGYSVVAVTNGTLFYWANATAISGAANTTWTSNGNFTCVDMSSDGTKVVAGGPSTKMIHFWSNAREQEGTQEANWVRYQSADALDIAMSDNGDIITAPAQTGTSDYTVYLMKSDGGMISEGEFNLLQYSPFVSMSGNGNIIAVGGPGFDSLYVFEVLEDSTSPLIENVYQEPANDTVTSDDEVLVYANVSDNQTGVKQVILSYTTDNETWFIINMTNLEGNTWNGTIPTFDYCTWVNYIIIAEDKVDNTITSEEVFGYQHQYHVIPEFPSFLILPLFMIATLLAVIAYRRKHSTFRNNL